MSEWMDGGMIDAIESHKMGCGGSPGAESEKLSPSRSPPEFPTSQRAE